MNDMNDIFKIDDIKTDGLRVKKEKAINELKEWFTGNLNNARRDSDKWAENSWYKRGYFTDALVFEPQDLVCVFEDKKAFVNWFYKNFPELNVPYDPTKRKEREKIIHYKIKVRGKTRIYDFDIKVNQMARKRDLLLGTNNTPVITASNWRERIRDAQTKEEVEDIKNLLRNKELNNGREIDDLVYNTRCVIDLMTQGMQNLKAQCGLIPELRRDWSPSLFRAALGYLEGKIQNGKDCWGTIELKIRLLQEAGMKWSHALAYEALESELKDVYREAHSKAIEKKIDHQWEWISFPIKGEKKPEPTPKVPEPQKNPAPPQKTPLSPTISESESKKPLSSTKINNKLTELKNKVSELDQKKKEQKDKGIQVENIEELEEELGKLEENGSDISTINLINELKAQIAGLRNQLEEIKKSLKKILEETKDYTQKLFNWFKNKSVKKLIWQDNGELLVEKNDGKIETLSSEKVQQDKVLKQFKELSQQSDQKSLTFSELSQITDIPSLPDNTTNQKHWDKYGKYYIGTGIIVVLVSAGAIFYRFWIKKRKK